MSLAEQIFYAVDGFGTDNVALQAALGRLRNMSATDIAQLRLQYLASFPGESLDAAILGDLAGREDFEAEMSLRGHTTDPVILAARMNERRVYERGGFTNLSVNLAMNQFTLGLYTSSWNPLQQH